MFGYLHAVCAYVRMVYLAVAVLFTAGSRYPILISDQVSMGLAVLCFAKSKNIFYCHFPDQLLAPRRSLLKRLPPNCAFFAYTAACLRTSFRFSFELILVRQPKTFKAFVLRDMQNTAGEEI